MSAGTENVKQRATNTEVSWSKSVGLFKAMVTIDGKKHHFGYFDTDAEAPLAAGNLVTYGGVAWR